MAFLVKGKSIIAASNSEKSSPRFARYFSKGNEHFAYCGHAEMLLLDKIDYDRERAINVTRFTVDGKATMAKPCRFCQRYLQHRGIKRVNYTNWDGVWETMLL